jgi:hypothetical protein
MISCLLRHRSEVMRYGYYRGFCSLGIVSIGPRTTIMMPLHNALHPAFVLPLAGHCLPDHDQPTRAFANPFAPCVLSVLLPNHSEVMRYGYYRGFCPLGITSLIHGQPQHAFTQPSAPYCVVSAASLQ